MRGEGWLFSWQEPQPGLRLPPERFSRIGMTKRLILAIIILLSLSRCALAAGTGRIVSLAPNVTEILYSLGLEKRVVAVTDFCDWPPEAKSKPKVGGMVNPSLEAIVRMKPDIVIMAQDGNPKELEERIRGLGINTYVVRAKRLRELPGEIERLGKALKVEKKAEKLSFEIENAIAGLRKRNPAKTGSRALFIVWPEPLIVAGPGTAINDALELLGWENIAKDAAAEYPKYSIDEIIIRSPQVIFMAKGHDASFDRRLLKKLSGVRAVKEGRVYYLGDPIMRLSPRIVEGIREMAAYGN